MEEGQGLRITTWNVNGIRCETSDNFVNEDFEFQNHHTLLNTENLSRNPFGYEPWRHSRTFAAMFDILEADIVVMQETKIQRKDLRDDMVLVPGWDVFFCLPKHKKGYSGVAIYTRSSMCAPIRAEEGITGILTPPNSTTSFFDLPKHQQIGGYPTPRQLADSAVDAATLDSEGRCVILEFPAFVLIGTYCPAHRDETRDDFRIGFLTAVDARIRNLVSLGKKVFWTGDLNIIRDGIDTAKVEEQLNKQDITLEQYLSTDSRRMLNQLLIGGRVFGGERDEGREQSVMWDICREFHPTRRGMFTCWEQKINARPGNFGSRIDYVLCSQDWKEWFGESNIQEGLLGSDHCPVYAVLKQKVMIEGQEVDIRDVMSDGMFKGGIRQREWSAKDLLPLSARLIPEFDRRRSIKDMFGKRPTLLKQASSIAQEPETLPIMPSVSDGFLSLEPAPYNDIPLTQSFMDTQPIIFTKSDNVNSASTPALKSPVKLLKRSIESTSPINGRSQKRGKASSTTKVATIDKTRHTGRGQSSLMGFFKPKTPQPKSPQSTSQTISQSPGLESQSPSLSALTATSNPPTPSASIIATDTSPTKFQLSDQKDVVDPIVAKESWGKLLGKRVVPKCEHNEPCISMLTKKPGVNCGRSFYMCPRPIGPSGQKEKNSQWRCGTFIWSSDWTGA